MSTATKPREAEKQYTIAELARIKSVSPDFIRAAIKRTDGNVLVAKKVGRSYRIAVTAAESWWSGLEDA